MPTCGSCGAVVIDVVCVGVAPGRGEVLLGELVAVAGEGVTDDGLDQPEVAAATAGFAVNFVVTSRECEEVGWTADLAVSGVNVKVKRLQIIY